MNATRKGSTPLTLLSLLVFCASSAAAKQGDARHFAPRGLVIEDFQSAGEEFDFSDGGEGPSAGNSAHGFQVRAGEQGLLVRWNDDESSPRALMLRTASVHRGATPVPLEAATFQLAGARVCATRGSMTEWFVNSASGLEHGWTLEQPPLGEETGEIIVDVAVEPAPQARLDDDALGTTWLDEEGRPMLRYAGLVAKDARGRILRSRMERTSTGLSIHVHDGAALYPVTIDPTLTRVSPPIPRTDNLFDFGHAVATLDFNGDGLDDILIGAPNIRGSISNGPGRARIYFGARTRGYKTPSTWYAVGSASSVSFASSVASAGDVDGDGFDDVIVGQPSGSASSDPGTVFLYRGSTQGGIGNVAWTRSGTQGGEFFGYSVSSAGDVNNDGYDDVVVGAMGRTETQTKEGAAYLYLGSAAGLSTTAVWSYASGQSNSQFGCAVARAGDVNGDGFDDVLVGARRYSNGEIAEGRAFLFLGTPSGLTPAPVWSVESDQAGAYLGDQIAPAGDVNADGYDDVLVGAPYFDAPGMLDAGLVRVYLGSAAGLSAVPAWSMTGTSPGARFGSAVAGTGDVDGDGYADVSVGADQVDLPGRPAAGVVFTYRGGASGVSVSPYSQSGGDAKAMHYGSALAHGDLNGDGLADLVVGAPGRDALSNGKVHVVLAEPGIVAAVPQWKTDGVEYSQSLGTAVAAAGDVNGDGYADVIVGSPSVDGSGRPGSASVFLGSATGVQPMPSWRGTLGQTNDQFGYSVASAGDLNGDGYDEVVVGGFWYTNGQTREGAVRVYAGSPTGTSPTAMWGNEGNQAGAYFGASVAGAGDVNGDGFDDLLVGANGYVNTAPWQGRAYLYLGSAAGLSPTPAWIVDGTAANDEMGKCVRGAGDVDGDGYDDIVLVGKFHYLYLGSPTGPSSTPAWSTAVGSAVVAQRGWIAGAGDVNGDGFDDVILGEAGYLQQYNLEGRALLFLGSPTGLSATPFWSVTGELAQDRFGLRVGPAGDVDADGFADVLVTDIQGWAYLYRGAATAMSRTPAWTVGGAAGVTLSDASAAGDVNNDGRADVILGQDGFPGVLGLQGRATVHLGGVSALISDCDGNGQADVADIGFGLAQDIDVDGVPDSCTPPAPVSYCDGFAGPVACPCANAGGPGRGCANSTPGSTGARLLLLGNPSLSADTAVLTALDVTGAAIFCGSKMPNPGAFSFNDGLACLSSNNLVLMGPVSPLGTTASYPAQASQPNLHTALGVTVPSMVRYQAWYRDSASFCSPSSLNTTQALAVYWTY